MDKVTVRESIRVANKLTCLRHQRLQHFPARPAQRASDPACQHSAPYKATGLLHAQHRMLQTQHVSTAREETLHA